MKKFKESMELLEDIKNYTGLTTDKVSDMSAFDLLEVLATLDVSISSPKRKKPKKWKEEVWGEEEISASKKETITCCYGYANLDDCVEELCSQDCPFDY